MKYFGPYIKLRPNYKLTESLIGIVDLLDNIYGLLCLFFVLKDSLITIYYINLEMLHIAT